MNYLWRMAARNLGRNTARTLLSVLAVCLGVAVVIVTKGFVDGMINTLVRNSIDIVSGHVRIIDREYRVKERLLSLNYPVDGFDGEGMGGMIRDLQKVEGVVSVSPRIRFGTLVGRKEKYEGVLGVGVDPVAEDRLSRLTRFVEGQWLKAGRREGVIGYGLMKKLGLKVGDKITMVANTSYGSMRGYSFTLVGAIKSGLQPLDEGSVYIPIDIARKMLEMPGQATEIVVGLGRGGDARTPAVLKKMEPLFGAKDPGRKYVLIPWYEHNEMISFIEKAKTAYYQIYLIILLLASFVVINTMVMVVNERRKEIGMMAAMGFSPGELRRLFTQEGLLVGLLGSAAGVILGGSVTKYFSVAGIDISSMMESVGKEFLLFPKIYLEFTLADLAFAFVAGVLITMLAAYFPARKAARMEPAQALRTN